ncbi:translation elongation factor G [Batrachochytrium salamandrivorans]|nr:translation elongation factor G [Batrachochytrium salamandrivorans]
MWLLPIAKRRLSSVPVNRIRNLGVAAHVDAGKTTVCERMLFYSNKTAGLGEVHDGAATMDFLPQEQERGITINAAAISFNWESPQVQGEFRINLVDTPGHFDFTTEVERSLRVLDGAVIVFDSVEGVEAQTETVWNQANRYGVPRIAFANKMDRSGASLDRVLSSMKQRLHCIPLQIHSPIGEWDGFRGMYDLVTCQKIEWDERGGDTLGREFKTSLVTELPSEAAIARKQLFEQIADLDDTFAEKFLIEYECSTDCKLAELNLLAMQAVRRITCNQLAVPVLCGSALRNMGIQLVLDAVIDYLPCPSDRPKTLFNSSPTAKQLLGFVFKIQNDINKGSLAYARIYRGKLKGREQLRIVTSNGSHRTEKLQGLLQAEAKHFVPFTANEAGEGEICVLVGCPSLRTGDTLGDTKTALPGLKMSPPVFTVAIELESLGLEPKFLECMSIMTRDDPSLVFENDTKKTGQFLLSGIGELHLEVSLDRLRREHGIRVETSQPRVALRETLTKSGEITYTLDRVFNGTKQYCRIVLRLVAQTMVAEGASFDDFDSEVVFKTVKHASPAGGGKSSSKQKGGGKKKEEVEEELFTPQVKEAVKLGALGALGRGPIKGFPIRGVRVYCDEVDFGNVEDLNAVRSAAMSAMIKLCTECDPILLEPVFAVEMVIPDAHLGDVLSDLSGRRRGDITSTDSQPDQRILVRAKVPATELLSYAKILRSLTAGKATYSAVFDKCVPCTTVE